MTPEERTDAVEHPKHYTNLKVWATHPISGEGGFVALECIELVEALELGFHLGNVQKYLFRAGRSDGRAKGAVLEDLKKARWYLDRYIQECGVADES